MTMTEKIEKFSINNLEPYSFSEGVIRFDIKGYAYILRESTLKNNPFEVKIDNVNKCKKISSRTFKTLQEAKEYLLMAIKRGQC